VNDKILFVASDNETLREYHMREMAMSDYTSGISHARREGKQEGRQEIVRNMKAAGASLDIIQAYTGLSIDEIERL
jgi:predicted transposase/invertase (TIGR01784 family)